MSGILGIVIAAGSLIVMPLLARAKRRVAAQLSSSALTAEARQTEICMYLSAILLGGLLLNAILGWWWADPVAAPTFSTSYTIVKPSLPVNSRVGEAPAEAMGRGTWTCPRTRSRFRSPTTSSGAVAARAVSRRSRRPREQP